MPSRAYWMAVAFVRRRTAPLEAWYCGLLLSVPTRPSWDEMLMIDPPPARRMAGMAAFVPRNTPLALMSIVRVQSSTVVSSIRPHPPMPALLTRTFSAAKRDAARPTAACQSASLVTSSRTKAASPPLALMSASTAWPSATRMSPMTTRAPSRANRRASAAPIPRAPPLISATFPASLMVASFERRATAGPPAQPPNRRSRCW